MIYATLGICAVCLVFLVLGSSSKLTPGSSLWGCPRFYKCVYPRECSRLHVRLNSISNELSYPCSRGWSGKTKICCPPPMFRSTPSTTRAPTSTTPMTVPATSPRLRTDPISQPKKPSEHRNVGLLPDNCGSVLQHRITNGNEAKAGEFPWMAQIGFKDSNGKDYYTCGGTLINERYVLTAAHCLYPNSSIFLSHVRLGEFDINNKTDCNMNTCYGPVLDFSIEEVIPHEDWSNRTIRNDIALLRLKQPVRNIGRSSIAPICLPLDIKELNVTEYRTLEATGWGQTHYFFEGTGSSVLRKVEMELAGKGECEVCERNAFEPFCPLSNKQLCVLGKQKRADVCNGDSGGPLTVNYGVQTFQIGVTSFKPLTKECGAENMPSIFTNVASYMNWILDHIRP